MISLTEAAKNLQSFSQDSLRTRISQLEYDYCLSNVNRQACISKQQTERVDLDLLESALVIKQTAAQINEVIHAVGILMLLPHILEEDEQVTSLSLGAGNTGRRHDLETNKRIAEFKFVHWKGGSESIRQNSLFKDLFYLAEANDSRKRCLYVIGTTHPKRFLMGRRSLKSVMSKDKRLRDDFEAKYSSTFSTVVEYFRTVENRVMIEDVTTYIPRFGSLFLVNAFDDN